MAMAYIEPNCDMPWEVYLDWLEDQGNEDLRFIDPACLNCPEEFRYYHSLHNGIRARGEGYRDRVGYFEDGTEDFSGYGGYYLMGGHWGQGDVMCFYTDRGDGGA